MEKNNAIYCHFSSYFYKDVYKQAHKYVFMERVENISWWRAKADAHKILYTEKNNSKYKGSAKSS